MLLEDAGFLFVERKLHEDWRGKNSLDGIVYDSLLFGVGLRIGNSSVATRQCNT